MDITCDGCNKPVSGDIPMFEFQQNTWLCADCLWREIKDNYSPGEIADVLKIDNKPAWWLELEAEKECKRRSGKAGVLVG